MAAIATTAAAMALRPARGAWKRLPGARLLQHLNVAPGVTSATVSARHVHVPSGPPPHHSSTERTPLAAFGSIASPRAFTTAPSSEAETNEDDDARRSSTSPGRENPEAVILERALQHVGTHGWTIEAIAAGARDAGYPSVAHGLLPRGAIELVDFFMDKCLAETRDALIAHTHELQEMTVAERLKFGVRTRLGLLAPVLATWPQAMALGALPQNAPTTMQKLAQLSDELWYFAGDKSTDVSWYTKRAVLTGIYASTELFLLTDVSPGFEESWRFLDRRVEETIALGELPRNFNDVAGMMSIGIQSILSATVSLAGPLGSQIIRNSPLGQVPNPISAIGNVVPTTVVAGFPPNPLGAVPTPPSPFDVGADIETKDLREIDEELEKLGGRDSQRQ